MNDNSMIKREAKRKWFFINVCAGGFLYGLSLTAYYPTEYYYLKKSVKVDNPDLYYGLSWAFLYLSGVISGFIGSYYADLTKNGRQICLLENVLNIVGNIMYALYYSPVLILTGQLLVGTTAARITAGIGELPRIYDVTVISQKIAIAGIFSALGALIGPSTTFLFQFVDFNLGTLKINLGNAIGIAMVLLYTIQLVLNYLTLHNVSKEYTLKEEFGNLLTENDDNADAMYVEKLAFSEKYSLALKMTLKNKHIRFWFCLTFLTSYSRILILIAIPVKVVQYLHWTETDIALMWIIALSIGVVPPAIIITWLLKHVNDFYQYLASMVALLLAILLLGLLPMMKSYYTTSKIFALGIAVLLNFSSYVHSVFSKSILAKFVPENIQATSEGIRNALFQLSFLVGGLTVVFPSKFLSETMFLMAFVISGCTAWYISEQEIFMNIKVICVKYSKLRCKH